MTLFAHFRIYRMVCDFIHLFLTHIFIHPCSNLIFYLFTSSLPFQIHRLVFLYQRSHFLLEISQILLLRNIYQRLQDFFCPQILIVISGFKGLGKVFIFVYLINLKIYSSLFDADFIIEYWIVACLFCHLCHFSLKMHGTNLFLVHPPHFPMKSLREFAHFNAGQSQILPSVLIGELNVLSFVSCLGLCLFHGTCFLFEQGLFDTFSQVSYLGTS